MQCSPLLIRLQGARVRRLFRADNGYEGELYHKGACSRIRFFLLSLPVARTTVAFIDASLVCNTVISSCEVSATDSRGILSRHAHPSQRAVLSTPGSRLSSVSRGCCSCYTHICFPSN